MKKNVFFLVVFLLSSFALPVLGADIKKDSLSIAQEAGYFLSGYQKRQFNHKTLDYGFRVVNRKGGAYLKYRIYDKMEEIIWYMHDSSNVSDEEKSVLQDTILYLYDRAAKYDPKNSSYYLRKKAFVLEDWKNAPLSEIIPVYEKSFAGGGHIPPFYRDRLGSLYIRGKDLRMDWRLKGLKLYAALWEQDPDNGLWIERLENLSNDEMFRFSGRQWLQDRKNPDNARLFASIAASLRREIEAKSAIEFLHKEFPSLKIYGKILNRLNNKSE